MKRIGKARSSGLQSQREAPDSGEEGEAGPGVEVSDLWRKSPGRPSQRCTGLFPSGMRGAGQGPPTLLAVSSTRPGNTCRRRGTTAWETQAFTADLWEHLISLEVPLHASGVESSLTHPRSAKTKWPGLAGRLGSGVQGRAVLRQGVSLALALRSCWVRPSSEGKALRSREEPLRRTGRDYTWVRDPLQ